VTLKSHHIAIKLYINIVRQKTQRKLGL